MAMSNDDGATNNNLNKKQMSYHNHDDEAKSIVSSSVTMEPEITATDGGMTESVSGVENATTSVKFHIETLPSSKSHKSSPVWAYFAHFDLVYHPDRKTYRICLVCRSKGKDKAICVGKDFTPGPLITHLRTHHEEYMDYLTAKRKVMEEQEHPKDTKKQKSIIEHFPKLLDVKALFKLSFSQWVVEDSMPLTVGESKNFKGMIRVANKALTPPDNKALKDILQSKKQETSEKLKAIIKGKYFALTTDHWTSVANENYGAVTIHFIEKFELKTFILSCTKHENGASAEEMVNQLVSDMDVWSLGRDFFMEFSVTHQFLI